MGLLLSAAAGKLPYEASRSREGRPKGSGFCDLPFCLVQGNSI